MFVALQVGQKITPKRLINQTILSHWKYARECASVGGGLVPGTAELTIAEIFKGPGPLWLRTELPGRFPPAFLKISAEEYAGNFLLIN